MKQEGFFIVIPHILLSDKRLADVDKLVYGEISALANKEGFCFASNKYIGETIGKSAMAARRSIYKLRELGYIHVDLDNEKLGRSERKIYINLKSLDPMSNLNRGMFKKEHPPRSKVNTNNNNLEDKLDNLAEPQNDKIAKNVDNSLPHSDDIVVERTSPITGKNEETARFSVKKNAELQVSLIQDLEGFKSVSRILKDGSAGKVKKFVDKQYGNIYTAHQAYGIEAANKLRIPSKYYARIIKACRKNTLYDIQGATKKTFEKNIIDEDERFKYLITCLNNPGSYRKKHGNMSPLQRDRISSL